ncbi:putative efflux protein, MATE family [Friedmanniella luteola]|uniref:Putative efflux protein, MATE family n=1 Tax=Friedmanniella luteola TaxID=546871 RepID=A0A1H1L027_9ACTN|nr:MATE family efflux transporter [Friedmanniella luteola]SDR67958.1 putative efflux protein, MATE family [Friedmanniella luteola]SDT43981.1 putative efflux protein, MATE family [Friedmanniella luteola]
MTRSTPTRRLDREIFGLALPTLATLVSEPLLLLADSAIIGHLGTDALAGLGIAANVLGVLTGLCIFLAYGTTGTVARRMGAGDRAAALAGGFDGLVLAVLLGVLLCAALQLAVPALVGAYGASPAVTAGATTYLRVAAFGLPSILLLLAGTGVLRGLQDTRTPLQVVIATNLVNIVLNLLLVHGVGLGIAGSALGTLLAQTAAAVVVAVVVVRRMRAVHARPRFAPGGVLRAARSGTWLVLRTATLQGAVTLTTLVATTSGTVALAAHQVVNSLWVLLAFALDALAIAGQAIIGRALGAGEAELGRAMTRRMVGWGVLAGVVFGLLVWAARPLYVGFFSPDPQVQQLVGAVLLVVAVVTPVAGVVYVLDGVLIGAGDSRYLALAGLLALLAYAPLALLVRAEGAGLVWLWAAYGVFMLARMTTLVLRVRTGAWVRTGAAVR